MPTKSEQLATQQWNDILSAFIKAQVDNVMREYFSLEGVYRSATHLMQGPEIYVSPVKK